VTALRTISDEVVAADAIVNVASHIKSTQIREVLSMAQGMKTTSSSARAISVLAPLLEETERDKVLQEAIARITQAPLDSERSFALIALSPCLTGDLLADAFQIAYRIEQGVPPIDQFHRGRTLGFLLVRLAEIGYPDIALEIVMKEVSNIPVVHTIKLGGGGSHRDQEAEGKYHGMMLQWAPDAFQGMAPFFSKKLLGTTWQLVERIQDAGIRARIFAAIGPYIDPSRLTEVLSEVGRIGNTNRERSKALVSLAPCLSDNLLQQAMLIASEIEDGEGRSEAELALTLRMAELEEDTEVLTAILKVPESQIRVSKLVTIAPKLGEISRQQAVREALKEIASDTIEHSNSLLTIGPWLVDLPAPILVQQLTAILGSLSTMTRHRMLPSLAALAPSLARVGGARTVDITTRAIANVGRWWP
jgi:hypothetical protein